jgi:FlaA1/EpsC-like NDP-sugar epimerase
MTRFNITLQEGVDFVIDSLERMWGGELFVPKIPSYKILDVAKAIAPEAKYKFVGIRPGEKLHEEMVTTTDSINTIEFNDYYVILPSTPLWDIDKFIKESNSETGKVCDFEFSYNSGTNKKFLAVEEIKNLISKNIDGAKEIIYGD